MEPPILSTGSHFVASPSVSSIRNVPSWASSTTRSWTTWYVVLLFHPSHGDVSVVYSDRRPRILSHPRLWPTNETTIGRSETPHFPLQSTYWCVPHLLHIRSIIPTIVDVEWGSDRTTPVVELKCAAYLRWASDPATVERGRMVHSLRTTGSGALNFYLVAQGAIDICW